MISQKLIDIANAINNESQLFPAKTDKVVAGWIRMITSLAQDARTVEHKFARLAEDNNRLRSESWEDGEKIAFFKAKWCEALSLSTSEADGEYIAWKEGEQ